VFPWRIGFMSVVCRGLVSTNAFWSVQWKMPGIIWLFMQQRRERDKALRQFTRRYKTMNRIHYPLTIAKHAPVAAAMFAFVLVFAGVANADAMFSAHAHKGKKGTMAITAPTEVGGILLQPGESGHTLYNQEVVGHQ
jgi:hypothetical protein